MSRSKQKVYIYQVLTKESQQVGRPTEFDTMYHPKAAQEIMALGASKRKCAEILRIGHNTFYEWCRKHTEFQDAIQVGIDMFKSEKVAHAVYKRAVGFTYNEKTYEIPQIPFFIVGGNKTTRADISAQVEESLKSLNKTPVLTKITTKYYPPDTNAAKFYLGNRDPQRWPKNGDLPGDGALMFVTYREIDDMLEKEEELVKRLPKPQKKGETND